MPGAAANEALESRLEEMVGQGGFFRPVLQGALAFLCDSLDLAFGALWAVDRHGGVLRCVGYWSIAGPAVVEFAETTWRTVFAIGTGLPGVAWKAGEPVLFNDLQANPSFVRGAAAARAGLSSGIAVPVLKDGDVDGVLDLLGRRSIDDSPATLQVLQATTRLLFRLIAERRAANDLDATEERYLFSEALDRPAFRLGYGPEPVLEWLSPNILRTLTPAAFERYPDLLDLLTPMDLADLYSHSLAGEHQPRTTLRWTGGDGLLRCAGTTNTPVLDPLGKVVGLEGEGGYFPCA